MANPTTTPPPEQQETQAPAEAPSIWSWRQGTPALASEAGNADAYQALRDLHSSALQAAETPHMARAVMLGSVIALVALILVLAFVPWRQTVSGSGEVTSFSPNARPQTVEAQLSARIRAWRVAEGASVTAGDTIAVLQDIKPEYLADDFVERLADNRESELRVLMLEAETAEQKLLQARQKLRASRAKLANAEIEVETAQRRYDRSDTLYADGLISLRKFETDQLKLQKAVADSVSAAADVEAAQQEVESTRLDLRSKQSKIEAKRADLDLKLQNAAERRNLAVVRAPIDGIVARINKAGPGQTVKEGGELALIVPDTDDQAAQIFVNGMDAAIVEPGRRVQLQFSGFPALQFAGFPGASIGTFSGMVRVIDPVDDGSGNFRLLIVPDTTGERPEWPDTTYLRQGSKVTGWVILSDVPLGYEIWRRMNGLPPVIPVRDKQIKRKPK
jgi:multidrug resistance efflux pump